MSGVREKNRAAMLERAREAFKDHVVSPLGEHTPKLRGWRCARPASWTYGFHVVAGPGFIAVTGDIGDRIFRPSDADAIGWLLKSRKSIDYVAGKCTDKAREYDAELALEFLRDLEQEQDQAERAKEIRAAWDEDDGHHAFIGACLEAGEDEPPKRHRLRLRDAVVHRRAPGVLRPVGEAAVKRFRVKVWLMRRALLWAGNVLCRAAWRIDKVQDELRQLDTSSLEAGALAYLNHELGEIRKLAWEAYGIWPSGKADQYAALLGIDDRRPR